MDVKLRLRYSFVLLGVLFVTSCRCEEELVPEAALPPRNFNPHPYQTGYEGRTRKFLPATTAGGLLLFPSSTPLPLVLDRRQYVAGFEKAFRPPVDDHPYHVLAYRRKLQQQGRFQDVRDDRVNPVAYKALSKHAAKVLALPSQLLKDTYKGPNYSDQKKSYSFSYSVSNQPTGDEFSHRQSQNEAQTKGEYKVKLPDGRTQIVSYTADDNGYNADVKYSDEEIQHEEKPKFVHIPKNNIETNSGHYINYEFNHLPRQYIQYVDDHRYSTFEVTKDKVQHVIHGNALGSVDATVPRFGVVLPTVYSNVVSTTSLPRYDVDYQNDIVEHKYISRKPYFI